VPGQLLQRALLQGQGAGRLVRELLDVLTGGDAEPQADQVGAGQGGIALPFRPGLGYFPEKTLPMPERLKISSAKAGTSAGHSSRVLRSWGASSGSTNCTSTSPVTS